MKIALVSPYDYAYPGGVNTHISHIKNNFTRMGHEVRIIAPSSKPDETRKNGDIIVFGRPVPIRASGSVVRSPVWPGLVFSDRVGEMLKKEKFDVIHIHEPLMPTLATAVLHHSSQELIVGTFHAYRHRSWGYPIWKPIILNRWFNKLDGRIAVSNAAREFVSKYFPAEYTIIPNGIDVEHFAADVEPLPEFSDGKLNILFVGRIEKRKGFKYLLGAYEIVKRKLPECRLIVVGPRDRSCRKYQGIVERRKLKDVVFAGYVSYEDLPRYYRSADVFCSPAVDKESFGVVLLEAMASGKPTVASNITGYGGVISHGSEGLLVKPADKEALADGIFQLLNDEGLRQKLGNTGKAKVGNYSWEKVSRQVLDYYRELQKGGPGAVRE
ncbi:MAG TPA: glycosyltransferase family 4 protein [Dehalococcoidia bacterium]|nr:glycosyltransferase family 4 protein [Dehalococcoidia bacterium]